MAAKIAGFAKARVSIDGHTDDVGTDAANQALSEARARAVRDFFTAAPALKGAHLRQPRLRRVAAGRAERQRRRPGPQPAPSSS